MRYHNITKDDMLNGDGLRVVLWVAGCSHRCKECQNPITWNPDGGLLFDDNAKKEIFEQLDEKYISGITFSGGDPLHENNLDEVLRLIKEIRHMFPDKTIWLYTGYLVNIFEVYNSDHVEISVSPKSDNSYDLLRAKIISICDVLVDGSYEDDKRDISLHWRGSSNQRVIDIKKSLEKGEVVLWNTN